jgi:glycosyltransferase involved in cell wall biosynthesis
MKKVDVIIPFHRPVDKFLIEAIESVKNSKGVLARPILVNNNIFDSDSTKILKQMGLNVVEENKQGYGNCLNTGIRIADSEYISFLNSDDIQSIDRLRFQISKIEDENTSICISGLSKFGRKNSYHDLSGAQPKNYYSRNFLLLGAYGANASILTKNDFFIGKEFKDTELTDWEFAFTYYPEHVSFVDEPLYFYRMHKSQTTRTRIPRPDWLPNAWRSEFSKISSVYIPDSVIFAIAMPFILKKLNKSDFNLLQDTLFLLLEYFDSLYGSSTNGTRKILVRRLITAQFLRLNLVDILSSHAPFDFKTKYLECSKLASEILCSYDNLSRKF